MKNGVQSNNSKRRSRIRSILFLVIAMSIPLCVLEIGLRMLGHRPWKTAVLEIAVDPGGKMVKQHPTLGYTHLPGDFNVSLATGYSFQMTHSPDTLRITHPQRAANDAIRKPEIWILGGSFTHGWSVNDDETYAWLLQERIPELEVVNFGCNGYGTIHALDQIREALVRRGPPRMMILAYASFHDPRNTFLRIRRKHVVPWNKLGTSVRQPYAVLDRNGNLEVSMARAVYTEFPLMRYSAAIHFLEESYNRYEIRSTRSHAVSRSLIAEIDKLCRESGATLVVAGIINDKVTALMLDWCRDHDIRATDISVDLESPGHRNLPHDTHPSPLAHSEYATKLYRYLKEIPELNSTDNL